jgi:hypothetical protein
VGTSVGSIDLDLELNQKGFSKQLSGITSLAKKAGTVLAGAFAVKKLIDFGKQCLELGSDLAEVQNVVDVTFTTMSSKVDAFAKSVIKSYGMSETVTKKYMGTFGAMSKSFGFSEGQAYKMAESITALTGDVASFYNLKTDEAYTKLKSIWTGETESLKDLGVVMTQTALDSYALANGYNKTTAKMSEAEKVALRYAFVQDKLSAASGDFARTSGSWANQVRVLNLQFDSLKATLGQALINLFTPAIKLINKFVERLNYLADYFKSIVEILTGNKSEDSVMSSMADSTAESTENISDATSEAKKLKGVLAGFDELNVLSFDDSSADESDAVPDVSGNDGNIGTDIEVNPTVNDSSLIKFKEKFNKWKEDFDITVKPVLSGLWNGAKATLKDLKDKLSNWFTINIKPVLDESFMAIVKNLIKNGALIYNSFENAWLRLKKLGSPLSEWFNTDFTSLLTDSITLITDVITGLNDTFTLVFTDIMDNVLVPFAESFVLYILPVITQFADEVVKTLDVLFNRLNGMFQMFYSDAISPALKLSIKIWMDFCKSISDFWNKWGAEVFSELRTAINNSADLLTDFWNIEVKPIVDNIMQCVDWLWSKHLKPLLDNFLDFVGVIADEILKLYNENIVPISDFLIKTLGPMFSAAVNTIVDVVGTAVAFIIDIINSVITVLKGVVQFISGVLRGDLKTALEGLVNIFKGFIDGVVSIFKAGINLVIDFFNLLISGAGGLINGIVSAAQALIPGGEDGSKPVMEVTKIPKLATGGIISQPTLAMVGERGREAVMPLENNTNWINELAGKIAAIMTDRSSNAGTSGNNAPLYIELSIGGTKFGKVCVDSINKLQRKTGKVVLEV